jgi:hypothetical protein
MEQRITFPTSDPQLDPDRLLFQGWWRNVKAAAPDLHLLRAVLHHGLLPEAPGGSRGSIIIYHWVWMYPTKMVQITSLKQFKLGQW